MKLPPTVYSALGGAVAASLVWVVVSPHADREAALSSGSPKPQASRPGVQPISALGNPSAPLTLEEPIFDEDDAAKRDAASKLRPDLRALPSSPRLDESDTKAQPTREELARRARLVEDQANAQLQTLADRLGLTEEQQDRIFPILASSSPAYHPSLQPEGGSNSTVRLANGEIIYGDGNSIKPGAPIGEIENEIYPELNEFQQAGLEEEAMDREAWWEDIVGLLEKDLEDSTGPGAVVGAGNDGGGSGASGTEFTEEERDAASETNSVDDFSDLLFGN